MKFKIKQVLSIVTLVVSIMVIIALAIWCGFPPSETFNREPIMFVLIVLSILGIIGSVYSLYNAHIQHSISDYLND